MKIKIFEFLGGEPLLDPQLLQYFLQINSRRRKIKIYTNGLLINAELVNQLSKLKSPVEFVFKFDALAELQPLLDQEEVTKLYQNIKLCQHAKLAVSGNVVLTKRNYRLIPEILHQASSLQLPLTFERYMPIGDPAIDSKLELDACDWQHVLQPLEVLYRHQTDLAALFKGCSCSCYVDLISIDAEGLVKPCPLAHDEQAVGTVLSDNLATLWSRFKRQGWNLTPTECLKCDKMLLCHGGCKTYTYLKYQAYNKKDPLCKAGQNPISVRHH